ncbi:HAP2 (YGL237C) [Zygosaccharomyces parabailii]|nr:HAP2 (YGL237C) [Zygosaccharomyces parabailii]CDH11821.1 uncharacterized protein ZBAI_03607 [Zygosaccharomyces bailii ISA1307]
MNEEGQEHQPLDVGLLRYSSGDIGIRNGSSDIPGRVSKVAKNLLVDDANPAEIYLYDHPQVSLRQGEEPAPLDTQQAATYNNEIPRSAVTEKTDENLDTQITAVTKQRDQQVTRSDSQDGSAAPGQNQTPEAIPANQEMQSADALLTKTNFDNKQASDATDSAEQPFYVNAKQYYRILKRRYTRAKLEENLRISRERKPYLHESRHKHAMRRPRGQGGRFLTLAEIEAMKNKANSASSSPTEPTSLNIKSKEDSIKPEPPLIKQQGPKPKKLKPADGSNR